MPAPTTVQFHEWMHFDEKYEKREIVCPLDICELAREAETALNGAFCGQKSMGTGKILLCFIVNRKSDAPEVLGSKEVAPGNDPMKAFDSLIREVHATIAHEAAA